MIFSVLSDVKYDVHFLRFPKIGLSMVKIRPKLINNKLV